MQTNWRYQRTTVQSIARPDIHSTVNLTTGLSSLPSRSGPSPFIPRSNSLAFHPTEMLYGIGTPDGNGMLLCIVFLSHGLTTRRVSFQFASWVASLSD